MNKVREITRDEYEKMQRDAFNTIAEADHQELDAGRKATNIVNNILIDMEIPIPEKLILPDVTQDGWQEPIFNKNSGHWEIYPEYSIAPLVTGIRKEADAKVMAGGKKLVELNIAWLLRDRGSFKNMSPELQEVVNYLAEMGADVAEIIK